MFNPFSARNRLFWRTGLWSKGWPNDLMVWLAAGLCLLVVGAGALLLGAVLFGFLLLCVGALWSLGVAALSLIYGQGVLEKQVEKQLQNLLDAYTHATYPYGTRAFRMFDYDLRLDPRQGVAVERKDVPLPAWLSAAAEAFTHVDGIRVMPTTTRFVSYANANKPVPTAHERLALRAAVLSLLPPGVVPDWT